ncbi:MULTISPECIES: glycosyltransferase family 32 protein [Parabacteroides]|uniref:Glycosyl transferase n=1 Tax=Parabacteroides distasonis TaxID=823 RepID=A0A3L7ZNF1_PARDI|nr:MULTISPECIES: glycosyltransferase [Parabacteroides]NBH89785.1 hypothetical protein [Parabacteroides distasonis]RKU86815.1 hypothetical protein DW033_06275 [Parabacteroides sp. AF39-10AC]RLT72791.1 hypothetical protein D7V78_13675 [Parabacteroides distasonis]
MIPKIIHQIWSSAEELPKSYKALIETWRRDYPDWKYILWDDDRIIEFMENYYPQYIDLFNRFPYNIQRCDAIRYLFLFQMGGMYIDLDYESLQSIEPLISGKTCCFSEEHEYSEGMKKKCGHSVSHYFNNAMILSTPKHWFLKKVIDSIFEYPVEINDADPFNCILQTTGPWLLMNLYYNLSKEEQMDVYIMPRKYVTPFTGYQVRRLLLENEESQELDNCLKDAYAVHYFFNSWVKDIKNDV